MSKSTWLETVSVSLGPACAALLCGGIANEHRTPVPWEFDAEDSREDGHTTRRAFWCRLAERDVEVTFATRGVPGLRHISQVQACTAFDPPGAVTCDRRCVSAGFRMAWDAPPPLHPLT
jgi:hypothetical protein